eukprot:g11533.t1
MVANGVEPTVVGYTSVVSALAHCGEVDRTMELLREMKEDAGIEPNEQTYAAAILACGNGGQGELVRQVLRDMTDAGITPRLTGYLSAIRSSGECGMWREAVSLLAEMEEAGVHPTVSCYNAAIMACGKSGMWQEALDLLAEMPGKGLDRDSGTLSAAISACQKAGRGAKAAALVEEMMEMNKEPEGGSGGDDDDGDTTGEAARPPPSDPRFSTVTRMELTKTVHTPGYAIRRPKEGFDRLTANRTNYSLGSHTAELTTATAELQMKHPRDRPPVDQSAMGGPTLSDGSYRVDAAARDSVRRGGGGGEGVFGVRFDIINGRGDERARDKASMRSGPRRTLNNAEKSFLHPTDAWGDVPGGMYVDVLTGRERKRFEAPERGAGGGVRRDTVAGRTRPW